MIDEQSSTNKSQLVDAVINTAIEWYERDFANRDACTTTEAGLGGAVRELLGDKTDDCARAGRHVCGPLHPPRGQ